MTGVDPGVNCRVHQDIHERFLGAIVAEQNYGQPAQGKVLRHVVARLAGHDDVRARCDGKLSKVTERSSQNGDGAARVLGFAPHARVAAKGRGGAGGEIAQTAGAVEGRECAQAGGAPSADGTTGNSEGSANGSTPSGQAPTGAPNASGSSDASADDSTDDSNGAPSDSPAGTGDSSATSQTSLSA